MASAKKDDVTLVERKRTASESFHRAKPVELHRTRAKVVLLIPEAVKHSSGWRFKAAISQFDPRDPQHATKINLDEDDVEVLAETLRRVGPAMTEDRDGHYVAVRVGEDENVRSEAVAAVLSALTASPSMLGGLAGTDTLSKLDDMLRHLGRLATLRSAIDELEQAIVSKESREAFYQNWAERNSWAFGLQYLDADEIRTISREDQVDLLLPRIFGGYRDLVELKTPTVKVLDQSRDFYHLARAAASALGQALHYTSVLQRHAHGFAGLQGAEYIRAYRVQAIVVIGSSVDWNEQMRHAWHSHNRAFSDVQLWTFEELLQRGRQLLSVLSPESS